MRAQIIFMALLMSGCAATTALTAINYQMVDNPQQEQIELSYRNDSSKTMCLLPEHWPNPAGKINQASDVVHLIVGGERFAIEDTNTGYCPQGCALHVEPGEQITSFIPYSAFQLPHRLVNESKRLEFSPMAFECRPRKR